MNFSKTRYELMSVCTANDQLKFLNTEHNSILSSKKWTSYKAECENLKSVIEGNLKKIIESKIRFPKKNSANIKKKKCLSRQLQKKKLNDRSKLSTINIDNWLKEKENDVDEKKAQESILKNVDVVLFDVRSKQTDTKKFISLLRELKNLRKIKVIHRRNLGKANPDDADQVFNSLIEKLIQQWMTLDEEYNLEERGLKLMIKNDIKKQNIKSENDLIRDWMTLLFKNNVNLCYESPEKYLKTIMFMRRMWDNLIDIQKGTKLPIGWIMPEKATCTAWDKYIERKTSGTV